MTARVYKLRRVVLPQDPAPLLRKLAESAEKGVLTGIVFVAMLDGRGYIAETCGEASTDLTQTRLLVKALDAKLAKRQLGSRE